MPAGEGLGRCDTTRGGCGYVCFLGGVGRAWRRCYEVEGEIELEVLVWLRELNNGARRAIGEVARLTNAKPNTIIDTAASSKTPGGACFTASHASSPICIAPFITPAMGTARPLCGNAQYSFQLHSHSTPEGSLSGANDRNAAREASPSIDIRLSVVRT